MKEKYDARNYISIKIFYLFLYFLYDAFFMKNINIFDIF